MQKVGGFFSLQRKPVLPLNMQNELAELAGFFLGGGGFMSVRSNAFKLGSVLLGPVYEGVDLYKYRGNDKSKVKHRNVESA